MLTVPAIDLDERKVLCFIRDKPKSQTCGSVREIKSRKNRSPGLVRVAIHYLYNPVLVHEKIRRLQVAVHDHRRTVVQIVHPTGLIHRPKHVKNGIRIDSGRSRPTGSMIDAQKLLKTYHVECHPQTPSVVQLIVRPVN